MSLRRTLRGVIFLAMGCFITLAPSARQAFGWRQDWLRPWVMFSGSGLEATEVRFIRRHATGEDELLDRYALLAPDSPDAAKRLRRVKDSSAGKGIARMLCRKVGVHPDVRVYLREATREGWKWTMKGERNLCEDD